VELNEDNYLSSSHEVHKNWMTFPTTHCLSRPQTP